MKKKIKILYVEDETIIRKQAVEYLSLIYEFVFEAKDGVEAIEVYKKCKPHIIISDIEMPKMNGLEMAKAIRKINKKIPIIIVTAHTQSKYLLEALDLQLIKYIVKPVTAEKLTEALTLAYEYIEEDKTESLIKLSRNTICDTLNQRLIINNKLIPLSHNEILFTTLLFKNHQRVVSYEEIEELIWAYEGMSRTALRTLVQKLRHKLQGDFIENVSGAGYRLKIEI